MNQNEILAVNNLILHKPDFIEFQKAIRKKTAKATFIIVIVCVAVVYIAAIVSAIRKTRIVSDAMLILMTFCLVIAVFVYIVFPYWLGGVRYKQYRMTHNSTGRMVFYSDRLGTMVGEETVQTLLYKEIGRIVQTEHLYIMEFSNGVYAFVRKDGFSQGSFEIVQNQICCK